MTDEVAAQFSRPGMRRGEPPALPGAVGVMQAAGCLWPAGERFVAGMRGAVSRWADDW